MWDHNQTHGVPGYFFTADEQCRFFFKGLEGSGAAEQDEAICQSLQCSNGQEVVETGPPLEGTSCGGEGTVLQHNPRKMLDDALDIDNLIKETNHVKVRLS